MRPGNRGASTVEALIALVLLAMGVLAASGVTAGSLRSTNAGVHARHGAWLAVASAGDLAWQAAGDGRCTALSTGGRSAADGTTLNWSFRPERNGLAVLLIGTYPVAGRSRSDTMWSFVPCQ